MNSGKLKNLATFLFSSIISFQLANIFYLFLIKKSNQASGLSRTFFYDLPAPSRWHYPDIGTTGTSDDVAILGDSYAEGSGDDWLNGTYKYSMMHYLKDKGVPTALFGSGGSYPKRQIKYFQDSLNGNFYPLKNSRNELDYPKKVLITIYGGNDLEDALEDFYEPDIQYKKDNIPLHFRYFPLFNIIAQKVFNIDNWKNRFKKLMNLGSELNLKEKNLNAIDICRKDKCLSLGDDIQSDSLRLNLHEVELGTLLIAESIKNFSKNYPGSVCTVYIPSPSLIYKINNFIPRIYYIKGDDNFRVTSKQHEARSLMIRKRFASLLDESGVDFIDSTSYLIKLGEQEIIHGENDYNHFSAHGYKYLANWLFSNYKKCF